MAFPSQIIPKCGIIPNFGWVGLEFATGSQTLPFFTPSQCTQCAQCTLGSTQQCYAPFGAEPPIVECHQSVTRSSQADASRLKAVFGIKFKHSKASDLGKLKFICRWKLELNCLQEKCHLVLYCNLVL